MAAQVVAVGTVLVVIGEVDYLDRQRRQRIQGRLSPGMAKQTVLAAGILEC